MKNENYETARQFMNFHQFGHLHDDDAEEEEEKEDASSEVKMFFFIIIK